MQSSRQTERETETRAGNGKSKPASKKKEREKKNTEKEESKKIWSEFKWISTRFLPYASREKRSSLGREPSGTMKNRYIFPWCRDEDFILYKYIYMCVCIFRKEIGWIVVQSWPNSPDAARAIAAMRVQRLMFAR